MSSDPSDSKKYVLRSSSQVSPLYRSCSTSLLPLGGFVSRSPGNVPRAVRWDTATKARQNGDSIAIVELGDTSASSFEGGVVLRLLGLIRTYVYIN